MRRPGLYMFVAILLAVIAPATLAQSDAEHQQFLFAYKLLQRGDVDEAAAEFDEYIGKFPKGPKLGDAQYYRALLHRKAGNNEKAALLLRSAAEPSLVPGYAVHLLAGQAFSDEKRYTEALASLEKIDTDELDPKVAVSALYLKGLAYRGADNLPAAATALEDASKLDTPMKARALLDLAKVRGLMKDNDKALEVLDRCLALEDAAVTPEAARFAGDLAYNASQYADAIGYYNTVVARHQSSVHFAPAVVGLLWAQFADGRLDEVQKTFDGAIQTLPVTDRLPAYYLAGSAQQAKGNHEKAAELLTKVAGGDGSLPIQEKVLYKLAVSRFELGQYDAMNAAASDLMRRFPDTGLKVDVAFLQATAEAESGAVERGAARLTEFVNQGETSPYYRQALLRRAHLYETHKEIEPAARDYAAYLKSIDQTTATSLQAGFRLMELLNALGKHDRVKELATAVLQLKDTALRTPEVEQEALYRLAVAHRFKGELNEALALHARLTREHPINPYKAEAVLEQGLIRMTQGDTDRGVPLLLDAAERDGLGPSSRINALRIVAQHYAEKDNDARAFELRMRMQEIGGAGVFSDDERVWLGDALIERGQADRALVYLAKVEGKGQLDRAKLLIGRAQRQIGEYDKALETLNEVRAVSERYNVDAWLEIALVYRDQGKNDLALGELAPLQDPDRGRRIAGQALLEAGQINKKLAMSRLKVGESEAAAPYAKDAREAFKKLWLLYPDREGTGDTNAKWAYLHLASLQHAQGIEEDEIKTLTELAEAAPDTPHATLAKAVLAERAGQKERSDAYVRQLLKQIGEGDVGYSRLLDEMLDR